MKEQKMTDETRTTVTAGEAAKLVGKSDETNDNTSMLEHETVIKDNVLQVKLEVMEQRFSDAQATIDDLRTRLDTESAERRQLTAQITDQRQQPEPQKRGFWARLVRA